MANVDIAVLQQFLTTVGSPAEDLIFGLENIHMRIVRILSVLTLTGAAILAGCGRGNGLPGDVTSHLAARGIIIRVERAHAPISSRAGYVVTRSNPQITTNIVSNFKLEPIPSDDRRWQFAITRAGGITTAKDVWGLVGRPSQFKLKSGGQFEYFYLIVTSDGWTYLVAEYAYG